MLPELEAARGWRDWALPELLREMDKQILPDGADYEGSTGYHRFVLESFLYSFVLCRANGIDIKESYWQKLRLMIEYLRAYLRPDGRAPLIGDTDGGQFLPFVNRDADDHGYLLELGAAVFEDTKLRTSTDGAPQELLWVLGPEAVRQGPNTPEPVKHCSDLFRDAGTCVMRHDDLYLLLNASGPKRGRPSSHNHNDKLSVEVSAFGRAFIVDPGSFVYTADLHERHLFRSTAYHSTVQLDDAEQMTISEDTPFLNGAEATTRIIDWSESTESEVAVAEHDGYSRLPQPVIHRRAIEFDKAKRVWLVQDDFIGSGQHKIATRFHFDAGLEVTVEGGALVACDNTRGVQLTVRALDVESGLTLDPQFSSRHYGSKLPSVSACWTTEASAPCTFRWLLEPLTSAENKKAFS